MTIKIGLTGGIGSGKTTVTNMFIALGIDVVDADIIAREVVAPGSHALNCIVDHFGADFKNQNGTLNRSLLRTKIFSNEDDKRWLNSLLHPLIRQTIISTLEACTSPYCLLVAPLLFENSLEKLVEQVIVVDVPTDVQLSRTLKRDTSSAVEIQSIIDSQISRELRLAKADYIIDNHVDDLTLVQQQVYELDQLLRKDNS